MLHSVQDRPGYMLISPHPSADRIAVTRLAASSPGLALAGFAPALSLVHEQRSSNIDQVFDYRRNRTEVLMRCRF